MILNLNDPEQSDIEYKFYLMPGDNQPHIQIEVGDGFDYEEGCTEIICSITSMNDLGKLLLAYDALARTTNGIVPSWGLTLPYYWGRQDNPQSGEAMTAGIFPPIILEMDFGWIEILHPHSIVTQTCFGPCFQELDHTVYVERAIEDFNPDFLIIPDLGAAKNAQKYEKFNLPQVQCMKNRDPKTGKLSGFSKMELPVPYGGKGLIVDDICDGGGTFMGIANLFDGGDLSLALYTTHGIYSKGFETLNRYFKKTYSTNSFHYDPNRDLIPGEQDSNIFYDVEISDE